MKTIEISNNSISGRQLSEICKDLKQGDLMIYPTDTLYAIGCDAFNAKAVERLCKLKKINPQKTNLSIICHDISQAAEYAKIDNKAFRILKDNTPGPFTFLFKTTPSIPKIFKGRRIVGIRIPDNDVALSITKELGNPLLTTSIEYDEDDYALNPGLIKEAYDSKVEMIIDNGDGGTEASTIIDMTGDLPVIIREGKGTLL